MVEIKQFEDKNLAHYSYAILSENKVVVIDPSRDPSPYYTYAKERNADIVGIIETHPHADFISSHLEMQQTTGATIYVSDLLGADYPHQTFDNGDRFIVGEVTFIAMNTPGHSPDSISVLIKDGEGDEVAVFTGDTLFISDCGRPDLREQAGKITAKKADLARQMYHSLRDKLMPLPDHTKVFPAHGAGSLCGKGLSQEKNSTVGAEKISNWSLQKMSEKEFVENLLADQPYVPKYFPYDVAINKSGAPIIDEAVTKVPIHDYGVDYQSQLKADLIIIDTRPHEIFKKKHIKGAINLMDDTKFESWLGSIVGPDEKFYLIATDDEQLQQLIRRIAKIGYESLIEAGFTGDYGEESMESFDADQLKESEETFTIVDIRNPSETSEQLFEDPIMIPLYELRERTHEIPREKPIVVHCAGGFRSAAGSSIVQSAINNSVPVFDLSTQVKSFKPSKQIAH